MTYVVLAIVICALLVREYLRERSFQAERKAFARARIGDSEIATRSLKAVIADHQSTRASLAEGHRLAREALIEDHQIAREAWDVERTNLLNRIESPGTVRFPYAKLSENELTEEEPEPDQYDMVGAIETGRPDDG